MEETRTFTRGEFLKEASKVIMSDEMLTRDPMLILMASAIVATLGKELFDGKTPNIKEEGNENE